MITATPPPSTTPTEWATPPAPTVVPVSPDVLDIDIDAAMDELFAELASTVDEVCPIEIREEPAFRADAVFPTCSTTSSSVEAAAVSPVGDSASEMPTTSAESKTCQETLKPPHRPDTRPASSDRDPRRASYAASGGRATGARPPMATDRTPVQQRQAKGTPSGTQTPRASRPAPPSSQTYRPAGYDPTPTGGNRARPPNSAFSNQSPRTRPGRPSLHEEACRSGSVRARPVSELLEAQYGRRRTTSFNSFDRSTWPEGLLSIADDFHQQARRGIPIGKYTFVHHEGGQRFRVAVKRNGKIHVGLIGAE